MESPPGAIVPPCAAHGLQQMEGSNDVGLDKSARPRDGTIHVGFRRQMQHMGDGVPLHDLTDGVLVPQVRLLENIFRMAGQPLHIFQMPRVCQAIHIDQPLDLGLVNNMMNQVRPDKTGSACYQQVHFKFTQFSSESTRASSTGRSATPVASSFVTSNMQLERGVFAAKR